MDFPPILFYYILFPFTENGETKTIDMSNKWSTAILEELMNLVGGESWRKYILEAAAPHDKKSTS